MTDTSKIDAAGEALVLTMIEHGVFEIDEQGQIWRVAILQANTLRSCRRRRAEYKATNGYLRIRVMVDGVRVRVSAHRVVYRYFYGDIPEGHIVDHEDRIRTNNRPTNLEPITQQENVRRGLEARLCSNCGSDRHLECCERCGALVPSRRRGTGFCTRRCETEQADADKEAALAEW